MIVTPGSPRWAVAPYSSASRTPSHGRCARGAAKRSSPTGGSAKGMPRKAAERWPAASARHRPRTRPAVVSTSTVVPVPINGMCDPLRSGAARDEAPELQHVFGHVDRRVEHPLGLQAVGCSDEERGGEVGVELGVDAAGLLLVADEPAELPSHRLVACDEEVVRRVLGIDGLDGELRVELHEPRHVGVVPDHGDQAVDRPGHLGAVALEVDLVAFAENLLEELLLRAEVVQETGLAEAHGVGELAYGGAAVPVARDHVEGRREDLLTLRDALRVRTPAC